MTAYQFSGEDAAWARLCGRSPQDRTGEGRLDEVQVAGCFKTKLLMQTTQLSWVRAVTEVLLGRNGTWYLDTEERKARGEEAVRHS